MSERNEKFESAGTPRIGLRLPAGEARFVPGPADSVEIRMTGSADSALLDAAFSMMSRWLRGGLV